MFDLKNIIGFATTTNKLKQGKFNKKIYDENQIKILEDIFNKKKEEYNNIEMLDTYYSKLVQELTTNMINDISITELISIATDGIKIKKPIKKMFIMTYYILKFIVELYLIIYDNSDFAILDDTMEIEENENSNEKLSEEC